MLAQGQLTDTASAIITVGASEVVQARTFLFYNNHTSDVDVYLYFVPNNGGSLGTTSVTNRLVLTVFAEKIFTFSPPQPITYAAENDAIFASAETTDEVNYFVIGSRFVNG